MNKVVIGADLSARLRQLTEPSFLADEAGNAVAYVVPLSAADAEPSAEERDAARDEYRRVGGLTTAEAIAYVRGGGRGMNFRVIWLRIALNPVARAYTDLREAGGDTESITRAMSRIDTLIERDPYACGESRSFGERILTEAPLTVRYEVHDTEQVVVVWKAVFRPRPG